MNIVESFVTNNECYKSGKTIKVKGLMLHSIGCAQSKASVLVSNYSAAKPGGSKVCVHAFIDSNDGTVMQILPWDYRGWHCGSGKRGSYNNSHIGIEMCESNAIKYTGGSSFTVKETNTAINNAKIAYDSAVELFAKLCKDFDLDPLEDGVIVSHKEGHDRGMASNHGDPEHYWKGLGLPYTMDGFRSDVANKMKESLPSYAEDKVKHEPMPKNQNDPVSPIPHVEPFQVRVDVPDLNIRKGPGTNYDRTGYFTGYGVFTITETSGNWGRLKGGAGWISLKYATRL